MSTVVFVESNTTGTGELLVRKAIERGHAAVLVAANPSRYAWSRMDGLTCVALDTLDVETVTEFVAALSDVRAVFSSSEFFIEMASEVATRLGLSTGNSAAIRRCRDKQLLADTLVAADVVCPRTLNLTLPLLSDDALPRIDYPAVVKPRTGSGSVQVRRVDDAAALRAHAAAMVHEGHLEALVQPYVSGTEYSVETITTGGRTQVLGIVRKHLGPEPDFVEIGHAFPARLAPAEASLIEQTVLRALAAVDFAFGPAHTELRLSHDRRQAVIIEINPRLAGGLIPVMLDAVLDSDLLGDIIDLWTGAGGLPDVFARRFGEIRFVLPRRPGILRSPVRLPENAPHRELLRHFHAIRQPGDELALRGDFRDRAAAVICTGDCREAVEAAARELCARVIVETDAVGAEGDQTVRGLPAELQAIVYGGVDREPTALAAELGRLADLNEAHLLMLGETGLVDRERTHALLREHQALRANGFAPLLALPRPRGSYIMLEQYLIDRLGPDVGGVLQTGRSRNDINATLTRLKLRDASTALLRRLLALRALLVTRASQGVAEAFPIYSQYQPAQPGTLAHQWLAVEAALASECRVLLDALPQVDLCPLGAAAGAGTTLAIDAELVARLLGFERPVHNSLDAVASRSAALHFLSALNAVGVLLSRFAQDLQCWTTMESAIVRLPDELCGASSMMPQKRNPFLIEFVKARASGPLGALVSATAALSKTPYANSYEAGSPIDGLVARAAGEIDDALRVLQALVDGMAIDATRIDVRLKESAVVASAVAESLTRERKLAFRSAYDDVASALRAQGGAAGARAVLELGGPLADAAPLAWAMAHAHGGGPGTARLGDGIARACDALAQHHARLSGAERSWAEAAELRALAASRTRAPAPAAAHGAASVREPEAAS